VRGPNIYLLIGIRFNPSSKYPPTGKYKGVHALAVHNSKLQIKIERRSRNWLPFQIRFLDILLH
jgi:hypothetical protein